MTNGRSKSSRFEKSYQRALRALARMRRTGEDLTTASREERTDPRTVRKYVGTDLKRLRKDGKTLPTKSMSAKKAGRVRGGAVLAKPEKWIEINSTNF